MRTLARALMQNRWGPNIARWALALVLWASAVSAQAAGLGLDAHFVSDYVWRGSRLVKGPAFQPQVDVVFPGDRVHLKLWTTLGFENDPVEDGQPAVAFDRIDVTLDYRHPIVPKVLFFKVGGIYYINPGSDTLGVAREETVDILTGFILRSLVPLDIHIDANFDMDETEQLYVTLGIAREIPIGRHAIAFSAKTALTSTKPGGADSDADRFVGTSDTVVTGALAIKAGWLRITPQITGVFAARRTSELGAASTGDPGKDRFVFGVDFGFAH